MWLLLAVQFLLVSWAFFSFLYGSEPAVFFDNSDGLKNYFTLATYPTQPDSVSLFRYAQQQYPFGDYVYYTDNTPLLSVSLRILGIDTDTTRLLNALMALSLLISTGLCFVLLKRWTQHRWLIGAMALLLPWLSPQLMRLPMGHMNLSLSWVFLLGIYLMVRMYEAEEHDPSFRSWGKWVVILIGYLFLTAFIHLYYLAILGVMIGGWFVILALFRWGNWEEMAANVAKAILLPLIAILLVFGVIRATDGYYELRREAAQGYNWSGWNLNPDAQYTAYDFQSLPFPVRTSDIMNGETYSYLGNFALYSMLLLAVLAIFLPGRKGRFKRHFWQDPQGRLVLLIGLMGLGCWFTALGEYAILFQGNLRLHNPLSPFFYLSLLTDKATHFRCIARFNWAFFLTTYLVLIYAWGKLLGTNPARWKQGILSLLILLAAIDATDMARNVYQNARPDPLTHAILQAELSSVFQGIDLAEYQALMPLPYYHAGSEDYTLTIDPITPWATMILQASAMTDLPMMSAGLSRIPISHTRQLLQFAAGEGASPELASRLQNKPILVLYSADESHWQQVPPPEREPARSTLLAGKELPQRMHMELLREAGSLKLYRWTYPAVSK